MLVPEISRLGPEIEGPLMLVPETERSGALRSTSALTLVPETSKFGTVPLT